MKYIGDLITEVRRDTRNEDEPTSSTQVGISGEDFLRYANFAQEKCFAVAIAAKTTTFQAIKTIDLVVDTMFYEIEDNVYLGEHIKNVEYSNSGLERDYHEIREVGLSQRSDEPGSVTAYIRHAGGLLLIPKNNISGATVRATYDRAPDSLDLRRGQITASTTSAGALTALALNINTDDTTALARAQYLCINDVFGNVKMYNVPVTDYNEATGAFTILDNSFTYEDDETATVGDYVTVGKYTTTHSKMNNLVERYMAQYVSYKIFGRDSSNDQKFLKEDMKETLGELAQAYVDTPRDEIDIQIDNPGLVLGIEGIW